MKKTKAMLEAEFRQLKEENRKLKERNQELSQEKHKLLERLEILEDEAIERDKMIQDSQEKLLELYDRLTIARELWRNKMFPVQRAMSQPRM